MLCENRTLAAELEKDDQLGALLKQHAQFDRQGYRFVHRSTTSYDPTRPLYEYIAVKLS